MGTNVILLCVLLFHVFMYFFLLLFCRNLHSFDINADTYTTDTRREKKVFGFICLG